MSFEHSFSGMSPEDPTETTLTLPIIPETGPVPGYPELGTLTTTNSILPPEVCSRINEPDTREYHEVPPLFSRPVKAAGLLLAGLTLAGAGLAIGAQLNNPAQTQSAEAPTAPVPASASSLQSESASPSVSQTVSPSTSISKSAQTSPSASISPNALPSPSKTIPVVITPPTHKSVPTPTPTRTKPTPTAQNCNWPMTTQGDSEVRDTCAGNQAMVAYNGPSNSSGESFAIYPGLYVHDESQSGVYTKVSIGSGANKSYGFIFSDLIGNPYS